MLLGDHSTDDEDLIDFKKNPEIYAAFYEGIINQEDYEASADMPSLPEPKAKSETTIEKETRL